MIWAERNSATAYSSVCRDTDGALYLPAVGRPYSSKAWLRTMMSHRTPARMYSYAELELYCIVKAAWLETSSLSALSSFGLPHVPHYSLSFRLGLSQHEGRHRADSTVRTVLHLCLDARPCAPSPNRDAHGNAQYLCIAAQKG